LRTDGWPTYKTVKGRAGRSLARDENGKIHTKRMKTRPFHAGDATASSEFTTNLTALYVIARCTSAMSPFDNRALAMLREALSAYSSSTSC